ncbi:MAG: alpha/beta hydrolase [Planctomycetes bacterium]|nr:alpha/beta hydrolase [Planctomycetota bacterium]
MIKLPYTFRNKITVESETYKDYVKTELHRLKEKPGSLETIIRLENTLSSPAPSSNDFLIDHFIAADGQTIRFNKWNPKNTEHIFIFLNGLESHAGWFSSMAADFAKNDIATYALDRRGSGLNSKNTGKYRQWISDVFELTKIAKHQNPNTKTHLVSICFGAKLATACAIKQPDEFDSLIYMSPGISVKVTPTPLEKLLIALDALSPFSFNIPSPIKDDEMFTDSPDALYFLYKDKLRTHSPRASDFYQARKLNAYILKNLNKIKTPSLVLLAEKDQILNLEKTKRIFASFTKKPKTIIYPNSQHVIFFAEAKQKLESDILDYIQKP